MTKNKLLKKKNLSENNLIIRALCKSSRFNFRNNSRSQASFEYIVILGIAFLLLVPVFAIFYTSSVDAQVSSSSKQITLAGTEIISTAEKVLYQGPKSRVKLTLEFPGNLVNISIRDKNNSLVFSADMNGVITDFVFFSNVNLNIGGCDQKYINYSLNYEGKREIFVESCGKNATIYAIE